MFVCGFMLILNLDEIRQIITQPQQYSPLWESEGPAGGVWHYASENTYLFYNAFLVIWYLCGILVCLVPCSYTQKFVLGHFLLSMIGMIATMICMYCI